MAKPAYSQIKKHFRTDSRDFGAVVFVSDRKQARITALEFVSFAAAEDATELFKSAEFDANLANKVQEASLASALEYGVGMIHDGLT